MIDTLYPTFRKWSSKGSVFIISDTHFDDSDCVLMDPGWITPSEHIEILRHFAHKNDTLIHLGDVGDPSYLSGIKAYKVLILGNHDEAASRFTEYFDEIYTGPLFVAEKILLSHEPIYGLEKICVNIHGHDHAGSVTDAHINAASNVCGYQPLNLGKLIKGGLLSGIDGIHRITIDEASKRKEARKKRSVSSETADNVASHALNS